MAANRQGAAGRRGGRAACLAGQHRPHRQPREDGKPKVFGQLKEQQGAHRFLRRGLAARDAEWKLLCGAHNLLKLWRHTNRHAAATPIPT